MTTTLLETRRLRIRAFQPADAAGYDRIKREAFGGGAVDDSADTLHEMRSWIEWSRLCHEWFPNMHQPPYGDRAIVQKETDTLIGAIGYVPCLATFEQYPELRDSEEASGYATPEFGLYWVIDPSRQRQGYATEAAQAMVDHAFVALRLKRIIATTEYENLASQTVMRKLGMTLLHNPLPEPPWLQVVGVRYNSV